MDDIKITVAAKSDMGRVRTNNEDAFTVTDLTTGGRLESGGIGERHRRRRDA